jgi:hypothetical protein
MRANKLFARATLLVAAAWFAWFPAGCTREKPTGEVYGKVTVKDAGKVQAVTAGFVKFFPEAGGEPVATIIEPDGSYRATGVPVGRAKIAIETLQFKDIKPPPPEIAKSVKAPQRTYVPIPAKYEKPDTSGLAFDVEKGQKPFDIELQ